MDGGSLVVRDCCHPMHGRATTPCAIRPWRQWTLVRERWLPDRLAPRFSWEIFSVPQYLRGKLSPSRDRGINSWSLNRRGSHAHLRPA